MQFQSSQSVEGGVGKLHKSKQLHMLARHGLAAGHNYIATVDQVYMQPFAEQFVKPTYSPKVHAFWLKYLDKIAQHIYF